jgi:hypothetical protein
MRINHTDHPHFELVDISAEFCFPNIELEKTKIDFGCILNHTSKKISITMKNISVMPITYVWKFAEPDIHSNYDDVAINEVFDILPLNGELEPDQIEDVEFIFNSYEN